MAEKVIIEVIPHTGAGPFKKLVKDMKPAIQNSVKPLMEKCISLADPGDQDMEDASAPPATLAKTMNKKEPAALKKAKDPKNASIKGRPQTAAPMTAKKIHERLNKNLAGAASGKSKAAEDTKLVILDVGRKDKRNEADKKKRWHPEEIRGDYIEKLKNQTKSIFGEPFANKMYSSDFKALQKCLVTFKGVFDNEELIEPFLEVLDIMIKWAYIKSNEISNIAFLKDLYNFFDELVDFLIEREYIFLEAEGTIFCLCLVEKIGMNNNIVKEKVKEILLKVGSSTIFFPKKLMGILMKGLVSKNTKTTAECLECSAQMIQIHQLDVIHDKDVQTIAKQCESSDNGIRQGALAAIEEIYKVTGEEFWTFVGSKLSTKAVDIIKARLNASLGVALNSTPVEDRKDVPMRSDKSPSGIGKLKASGALNRSLNKSIGSTNKLNSSIPLSENSRKIGLTRNQDRASQLNPVQSSANLARSVIEPGQSRRKESSVNRKLERVGSSSRKNPLDANLEEKISKLKLDNDEFKEEILKEENDSTMELDENLDSIGKNIKQLKYGDLSGKVDALVIINELITKKMEESGESLIRNSNFLIDSICQVLYDVFNKTPEKVPLKFGKYFISIVNKVCSIEEIMRSVEERKILILVEQLLLKLLIPGLDTLGERNEGQAMFRNLNNTILRILENCHPTQVFVVFLGLLRKYKGYNKIEKLSGIIVKCLLKVTRIMSKIVDQLNIGRVLLATHEYLLTKSTKENAASDDVGMRITKTIVNELVKVKREEIWDHYEGIEAHSSQDIYIKKWIEIILMSLSGNVQRPSTAPQRSSHSQYTGGLSSDNNKILMEMIHETQNSNQFRADQAFKNILDLLSDNNGFDIDAYLNSNFSSEVASNVLMGLKKAEKRKVLVGKSVGSNISQSFKAPMSSGLKTPNKFNRSGLNATSGQSNRLSTVEKMQEYEEKRAKLRNKYGSKRNMADEDDSVKDSSMKSPSSGLKPQAADNGLGGSIAAMNSSITEKWRKLNSNKNGLNNTVGGGFKAGALQDKSTLDKDSNENEGQEESQDKSQKTKMALQARLNEVKARLGQIKKTHK